MAKKKSANKSNQTKKQLKKELAIKLESVLPEIKLSLGDKKFSKRIKKVTSLLTDGLHLNGADKKNGKKSFTSNGISDIKEIGVVLQSDNA